MKSFYALIDALAGLAPPDRAEAEGRIRAAYEVESAVFVLDMSGFSLSVRRSGIISHLCRIRQVQSIARPLVEANGGEVVKCEADNVLAVFDCPGAAVAAARRINATLAALGDDGTGKPPPSVGIGIDYGRFLLIRGQDAFGDPVNIAHKLGEDIARPAEILVTDVARSRLGAVEAERTEPLELSISGVQLHAWRIAGGAP